MLRILAYHNMGQASRPISTPRLHPLLSFHLGPIYLVVYQGPSGTGCPVLGDLFLGWASRLDAFSGYPIRTWLPGAAVGTTTGTPCLLYTSDAADE